MTRHADHAIMKAHDGPLLHYGLGLTGPQAIRLRQLIANYLQSLAELPEGENPEMVNLVTRLDGLIATYEQDERYKDPVLMGTVRAAIMGALAEGPQHILDIERITEHGPENRVMLQRLINDGLVCISQKTQMVEKLLCEGQ